MSSTFRLVPTSTNVHSVQGDSSSQQLKILIAYIALKYEIQPLKGGMPKSLIIGETP